MFVPSSTSHTGSAHASSHTSVSGSSSSRTASQPTTTSIPSSITSSSHSLTSFTTSLNTTSSSASSNSSSVYRLDIPEGNSNSNLKYLYLVFLLLGVIIAALVSRVLILKRRRAKKLEQRTNHRNAALRRDLENRASDENQPDGQNGAARGSSSDSPGSQPQQPARTPYTFPLFSMSLFRTPANTDRNAEPTREMEEANHPPPPYPTHAKPAAAYIRDARLPVYEEVSEEEERNEDAQSRFSDAHSHQNLRTVASSGPPLASYHHDPTTDSLGESHSQSSHLSGDNRAIDRNESFSLTNNL